MSNTMRYRWGATNPIMIPVDSAQVIEIGDFVWLNTDDARAASQLTDQGSESANQREFKRLFAGVAMQQSRSGDTDAIRVATSGVFEFTAVSASTYEIGDLIGVDENDAGNALEDQRVVEVTDDDLAIGRVAQRESSTVTAVLVAIHSTVMAPTNAGSSGGFDGGVIGNYVPQTVSDGDGSTNMIPEVQVLGTTAATGSVLIASSNTTNDTTVAPKLCFLKNGAAAYGTNTIVASGEVLGEIIFFGADGADFESAAARIQVTCSSTPGAGDMPGTINFQTSADGGETLTTGLSQNHTQTVTANKGLIAKSTQAAAITTTRTLTAADSGGVFSVAKTSAYAITLPTPEQGLYFKFVVLDTGANMVTISDGAAHLLGVVSINNVSTAMTGTTLSLASGGSVGDWVEFQGISATQYLVTGACIAAADIAIA
jgi:hypothetical protein